MYKDDDEVQITPFGIKIMKALEEGKDIRKIIKEENSK